MELPPESSKTTGHGRAAIQPEDTLASGDANKKRQHSLYRKYWRKMIFEGYDDYCTPMKRSQPDYPHSFVAVESFLVFTPYGELYLHQVLPLNKKTAKRIEKINDKVGEGYTLFSPFPDKRKR